MSLSDGYHAVPAGKVATIVTHLEMRARPELRPAPDMPGWALRRVTSPSLEWYRKMFREVGEAWLWFSRAAMPDAQLQAILTHPDVSFWTLSKGTQDAALLELSFHDPTACELAFFGLTQELIGTGAGRRLMNAALEIAWSRPIERMTVQTCTLDSPQALPFYIRSGFQPVRQEVQIAPDPRLGGVLPQHAAPQIPVISGSV